MKWKLSNSFISNGNWQFHKYFLFQLYISYCLRRANHNSNTDHLSYYSWAILSMISLLLFIFLEKVLNPSDCCLLLSWQCVFHVYICFASFYHFHPFASLNCSILIWAFVSGAACNCCTVFVLILPALCWIDRLKRVCLYMITQRFMFWYFQFVILNTCRIVFSIFHLVEIDMMMFYWLIILEKDIITS